MSRPVRARIDGAALRSNLERVRALAPGCRIVAVVKANAYGHGPDAVRALEAADAFGVAAIEEAIALREAGINHPLLLLEGIFEAAELEQVARYGLMTTIHNLDQLTMIENDHGSAVYDVWLKIDSGMHRLGLAPDAVADALARLEACEAVRSISLMSHLASADISQSAATQDQIELFNTLAGEQYPASLANSAGICAWPAAHHEIVRPGIMLYGASPLADQRAAALGLVPAMSLESAVIAIRSCHAGDAIGYGGDYICPQDMPVGVIAIGYGDGYPRHIAAGTPVLVRGRRVPIIGRVSMDMITVDLRTCPDAVIGDSVLLWGQDEHGVQLPIDEIATAAGTIAYELMCQLTARVPRVIEDRGES